MEEATLIAEVSAQGQEGGAAHGEVGGGGDAPAGHDHPARDGGQHDGRLQRQDLQPGGDQTRDDRSLPGGVLHYVQASEALPAQHWSHSLLPLHSAQVVCLANKEPALPKKKKKNSYTSVGRTCFSH